MAEQQGLVAEEGDSEVEKKYFNKTKNKSSRTIRILNKSEYRVLIKGYSITLYFIENNY